jgi:hypothetical protein
LREKFKDVRLAPDGAVLLPKQHVEGEREFRIGLVTASVGNWIVLQLTGGKAAEIEVLTKIQHYLFNLISWYKDQEGARVPLRIYDDGRWLVPELDLEYDLDTVNTLYGEALAFNFDPFFERQKKLVEEAKRLISNPPLSPKA